MSHARPAAITLKHIHGKYNMKIIDNKKDYYDYLAGIFGVDDLVVYDRRGSVVLNSEKALFQGMEVYFSQKAIYLDKPLTKKMYWKLKSIVKQREAEAVKHRFGKTWAEGDIYHFVLEVGYTHYRFEVERWLEENNRESVHVEYRLIDTLKDDHKRYSDVPMCVIPCYAQYSRWSHEEQWKEREGRVENPILAGTFIPGMIPPTDIWNVLYTYLSSLRDKPFTDSRSDIQKLETAGFDKKTSFRKIERS